MEHLDVLIVGAGLSGIGAANHLQDQSPWAEYAIFEARDSIGGTWDLFRYPGIRSDSDMHTMGYSFRPWTGGQSLADGESILQYIKDTAAETGIDRRIRFNHRILRAEWSTPDARWHVTAERTDTGEEVELTCGVYLSCSGYYRYDHGYDPHFEGREDFQGTIVHPQHWPEDLDYEGKRVVIIGSGATAVTLVPSMATKAAHVTMLQRSPTYIASLPGHNPLARGLRKVLPEAAAATCTRWAMALGAQGMYSFSKRRPAAMKRMLRKGLEREMPGVDLDTHFTPRYDPWDERLCFVRDGDLFEVIRNGSASVVTDQIERFTPTGIRLASGQDLDADIIVTATGLELLFLGGVELVVDDEKVDVSQRLVYKGMLLDGVPNLAVVFGYTNNSWTLRADLISGYVARLLNHLRSTGLRQFTARRDERDSGAGTFLGLTSGYVLRAVDQLPLQGTRFPWRVDQKYTKDYRALKRSGLEDDNMEFSNPVPPAIADRSDLVEAAT